MNDFAFNLLWSHLLLEAHNPSWSTTCFKAAVRFQRGRKVLKSGGGKALGRCSTHPTLAGFIIGFEGGVGK